MFRIYLLFVFTSYVCCMESSFLGCFKTVPKLKRVSTQLLEQKLCVQECFGLFYRYAYVQSGSCFCGNYLGEEIGNITCSSCDYCDKSQNLSDVYSTGNLVPGPPRNLQISNISDTSCRLSWEEPESFVDILEYKIKAPIIHTYSSYPPLNHEWAYSNNTFHTELSLLWPATKYNITILAKSVHGDGSTLSRILETKIGEPEPLPAKPKIIDNDGAQISVQLMPTQNNNGPISSYRVIVINNNANQGVDKDSFTSYQEAVHNGLSFYIAAELDPKELPKIFVIGDGQTYGGYYNAPLDPNIEYNIVLEVVSRMHDVERVAFSDPNISNRLIIGVYDQYPQDSPTVIIGLSVAIGLVTFMLIAGIVGFIVLKSKVVNRRQRLSDNQELTLQGPMIEVENNGYIYDDEHIPVNHYRSLKQKVHTISSNQLKIEPTNLLGVGKFGRVNSGSMNDKETVIPIAAYNIQDKKLTPDVRKAMLQDLDVLIKIGKHDNLISLLGTCETSQVVCIVLEYATMNLKDVLLGSRDMSLGRFSNMLESQALDIAIQICRGMAHLESYKIIHKKLCARSIMIAEGFVPKISNYGIAQYYSHNKMPDYTRWTAPEVFKNQPHNPKSDVWSMSCLIWEILTLGGTPYGNVSNNEIPDRIMKGLRLPQLCYISDELYQIMLDCWQLDCDERPKFNTMVELLANLKDTSIIPCLSFNMYPSFQYEQFYPDMELAVRPVF